MNDYIIQKKTQETWDIIASSFDKTRRNPWKKCMKFIKTLPKSFIVGDFGCGNGRHTFEVANYCQKVIAVDISLNFLSIIQKKLIINQKNNIRFIHGNLVNLPLKDNSIDAVLFIATLHNIAKKTNRMKSLKEVKRVIKKDGFGLISVWSRSQDKFKDAINQYDINKKNTWLQEYGDLFINWNQDNLNIPRYYHLYKKEEFKNELEATGFNIISLTQENISTKNKPDNYFSIVSK